MFSMLKIQKREGAIQSTYIKRVQGKGKREKGKKGKRERGD